jgi:hypothetical protein
MASSDGINWQNSLVDTYEEFTTQIIAFAPLLAGAVAVLIVGWFVAHILRIATRKLIRGLDSILQGAAPDEGARQLKIRRSYAIIAGNVVFWIVFIFFIAAAANMLGWKMLSNWMDNVVVYLPSLVSGLMIILAGFVLSNLVKAGVISAASSAGMAQGDVLGRVAQMVVIFTTLVIGIEQIGINVDFLTNVLIVIIGVLLAGAALAFGLGARSLVANIIGAQQLRKHCRTGEQMLSGDVEGSIVEVTQTCIVLDTEYGRTVIPAKLFQEQVSSFKSIVATPAKSAKATSGKKA